MSAETPALPAPSAADRDRSGGGAARSPSVPPPPRAPAPVGRERLGLALPPFAPDPALDAPAPRTRGPMLLGVFVLLVFAVGFGAWAVLAPLAEAAIAPGLIKVEGTRRTIQHLEGGIVREILVRDGAKVRAGQVLLRLDAVQADSSLEAVRAQRWALLAQDARLVAELAGAAAVAFPPELLASPEPRARDAVLGQRTLFEARRTGLDGQVQVLQARIEQQRAVEAGAQGQLAASRRQLELIRREEEATRGLLNQGLARLPQVLALQRAMAQLEGGIEQQAGDIERARATMAEAERQMRQARDQRAQEVSAELGEVRGRLAEAEEKLRAAADVLTRREIAAPEPGTIVNLRQFTVGGVVRPGDPVMELVPERDRLVAEVNVQPHDIDVVYPGLRAEVRLPAFKQRLVPYLHGAVSWVAADVSADEQSRQQYYRAHILIDREQLARLPDVFLAPGMPVEAHVQTGQRSFFRYLTQPIRDSFARAFKEQ